MDLHTIENNRLNAFLAGSAPDSEALITRVASVMLADRDPVLGTGGGLTFALMSGKLTTDASVVNQFTLSAARTIIAFGAQTDLAENDRITGIRLVSHVLGNRQLTLEVRLVRGGTGGTLDFTLQVA